MTKGKVVLIPFPFDDLSGAKLRPAVCLTDPIGTHKHIIVAFITSQSPVDPQPTDLEIDPRQVPLAGTGLRVVSTIRLHRLVTVTASLIQRQLGVLPAPALQIMDRQLRNLFQLP
jgi:mRNA interferase MazF